jgi:putative endonuclease
MLFFILSLSCSMRNEYKFFVYILSNFARTVLYVGVTNSLRMRLHQHKKNECKFTSKYKCHFLMYYEEYSDINTAIKREKQLKNWKREWKIELIKKINPDLNDLSGGFLSEQSE